jgi:FdhD protein
MSNGAVETVWYTYRRDWERAEAPVIEEALVTINVNGHEFVTLMCTPCEQDRLAVGMLMNEGLLESLQEIDHVHVSEDGCCVDVWLRRPFELPERRIITSGCGGGVTFEDPLAELEPLVMDLTLSPADLRQAFRALHFPGSLHARARGVHAAGLAVGSHVLASTEDVGRHNAVDKLRGLCLQEGIESAGNVLLATGRVSSEMLRKGVRMGCPIVASRNSPTSLSIELAQAYGVTLVGYVRRGSLRVYSHPERMGFSPE